MVKNAEACPHVFVRPSRAATPLLLVVALAASACDRDTPNEVTVAMPLVVASSVAAADGAGRPYDLAMSAEVTPTNSGDPDGTGTALITLNAGQQTVCWDVTARNIALPGTASHIHRAPAGLAGPIVLPLVPPDANGVSSGCAHGVDRDLILDMIVNPTAYYVNVHTTEHPPGAIRAQLAR